MTFKRFHRGSMGIFSRSNPIGDDRYESHSQEAHNGNRIGEGMFFTFSGMHTKYQYTKTGQLSRNGGGLLPTPYP
jgi:hypothetical protein